MANEIKSLRDLKLHYDESDGFKNILYCDDRCNEKLIAIYNKYKDVYNEDEKSQSVSVNRSESKLVDVVTDLDKVIETTHAADASFEEIEQMLKDHWEKKGIRSKPIEPYVNKTSESIEELEQRLKNYWRKKVSEKTLKIDRPESSVKATSRVYSADLKKLAKRKSTFGRHPSKELNRLYSIKSYQGANPVDAKVIFVGRDPNWAADIEETNMFGAVVEYLTDGISFWQERAIHHPFLLKSYRGDGRKYHRSFSKMRFDSSVASKISFVELIGFPTTGMAGSNSPLFKECLLSDANRDNLKMLDKELNDPSKIIFIAWGLTANFEAIYNKTGLLKRFAEIDKSAMSRTQLNRIDNVYIHTHFSDAISSNTIDEMGREVRKHLI